MRSLKESAGEGARATPAISTLAAAADVALDCSVAKEACGMGLAPTASTTAMLALGDALAMALAEKRGFQEEDFANLHPGGKLGKRLARVGVADAYRRGRAASHPENQDAGCDLRNVAQEAGRNHRGRRTKSWLE